MKRAILVLMMVLCAAAAVGAVHLVKSKFTSNYWTALIPADDTGTYWLQVGLGCPLSASSFRPYITILDMQYGKIKDGNQACLLNVNGTANGTDFTFPVGIPWDAFIQYSGAGFAGMSENGNADTRFVTYDPPDTHNEIHVIVLYASETAAADCLFMWSDDSTTDLAATDLGSTYATNGIREIIVLKGTVVGSRVLKIRPALNKYISIIGVRSWDTNTAGNPATDPDDCLVTQFTSTGTNFTIPFLNPANTSDNPDTFSISDTAATGEAFEFAINWDSGGTDYLYTGGNTHLNPTGNYSYVMAAEYTTDELGPELWVDGVKKGNVFNDLQFRGTHTTGANSATLVDTGQTWTVDGLIGLTVYNRTDGSTGVVTDNDATSCTFGGGLSGGTDNDFDVSDSYYISGKGLHNGADDAEVLTDTTQNWVTNALAGLTIQNLTDGSSAVIESNTSTTITLVTPGLAGGTGDDFDINDVYTIVNGWTNNQRGTAYSGDRIVIRSNGTANHNSETDPLVDWTYIIDDTGLTVVASIVWQSDIAFEAIPTIYTPMLPFSSVLDAGGKFRFPLDDTETAIPAENGTYTGKGSVAEILYRNMNMRLTSFNPVTRWLYVDATSKFYGHITGSFSGYPTPASGDMITLGGKYEVRRIQSNGSEYWQDIKSSRQSPFGSGGTPFEN